MSGAFIGGGGGSGDLSNPVTVPQGGTSLTTLTDGAVLVGDGVNAVELIGPLTDGQLLIGSTAGVSPVAANITAGANISIVNAAGAITISSTADASPLTTKGDIYTYDTADARLAVGADNTILTADSAEALGVKWAAASLPPKEICFPASSLTATETNFASLELLSGTTVKTFVRAFDDTTEEYVNGVFIVPSDIDTAGTVTFRTYVMAKTAAASKNVALTFGHVAVNDSEDFDVAYTDEDSGDKAIDATQDDVTEITWTETVSNLGWAASDNVFFRISRDPAAGTDLTGDMYMFSFNIEIPRA